MNCIRVDGTLQFFKGNTCVALTDETDELHIFPDSRKESVQLGKVYSEREARALLALHGVS